MPLSYHRALLLATALLLAVPGAHARKDDEDHGHGDAREQQYEQQRRGADSGRARQQQDDWHGHAQESRRYEQQNIRTAPPYPEPRRRSEPRGYDPVPRSYDPYNAPRSRDYDRPEYAPRGLSMSEAVSQAERRTGGRVLSAEPDAEGGESYYRIKVLNPDGRVQVLFIDAR